VSPPLALNDIGALSTVLWGEGSYSEQGAEIDVIPTPAVLSKAISHHEGHEVDKAETVSKLRLRWRNLRPRLPASLTSMSSRSVSVSRD
jgi:hypothetical protein